ncbi:MAG: tRNA (guanosine(37)-N1)-methyltransferase TrmD [Deltaproteobacteria bacterium]|nr:tRNA (guanosine(37)-N1)-methyltransferase TrmD [Deltaproteobacteria bacterium]
MLELHVITIFPELFPAFTGAGLLGKAVSKGLVSVRVWNLRDFTHDRHRSVDDTPYGGGSGMVMKPEPILEALAALPPCHRVLLTPQGRRLDQDRVRALAALPALALFCGRYEGVDERVRDEFDEEICLGDFVLNGGEVAAMAVIEAVSRLVPGVLGNAESVVEESFSEGLLEYPQYTRPEVAAGRRVPEVLLSGDHGHVATWRRGQALLRTKRRRPDLFAALALGREDLKLLAAAEVEEGAGGGEE